MSIHVSGETASHDVTNPHSNAVSPEVAAAAAAAGCPFHAASVLPTDGTPTHPSPRFAEWRETGPALPLDYNDGHRGLVVTQYDLARAVLEDPRFSMRPDRMPLSDTAPLHESPPDAAPEPELDDNAREALDTASVLFLDGDQHLRLRRSITGRFSAKSMRDRRAIVKQIVARQVEHVLAHGAPIDLFTEYARPIAAANHCDVLGIPDELADEFRAKFEGVATTRDRMDYVRRVVDARATDLGENTISDLLRSDLSRNEVDGLVMTLMSSGRDSVAYMISTSMVALLTNPEQLAKLRDDPSLIQGAVEEFMRYGTMFLTVFRRTATEDVTILGVDIPNGTSVSVSTVSANRDDRHWEDPATFDVTRDAFGHVGFGHGAHGCVGQQLARVEISEAITQLLAAIPDVRLVEAEQLSPLPFAHPVATYEAGAVVVAWG
ncbi:MAG: cytochrome [Glaciihabitans sp.]|nr:cytochrome [Glaciihabitans sp.]